MIHDVVTHCGSFGCTGSAQIPHLHAGHGLLLGHEIVRSHLWPRKRLGIKMGQADTQSAMAPKKPPTAQPLMYFLHFCSKPNRVSRRPKRTAAAFGRSGAPLSHQVVNVRRAEPVTDEAVPIKSQLVQQKRMPNTKAQSEQKLGSA